MARMSIYTQTKTQSLSFPKTKMAKKADQLNALEDVLTHVEAEISRARRLLTQLQGKSDKDIAATDAETTKKHEKASESLMSYTEDQDGVQVVE